MIAASKTNARILLIAALLPLAAIADPPARTNRYAIDASVTVMRGSQELVQGGSRKSGDTGERATRSDGQEHGVIVMRPAPGSFMRETTRLAAKAEAREERVAREEAREISLGLMGTLRAVEDAVYAVERRQRNFRYLIFASAVPRRTNDHRAEKPRPAPMFPPS